MRQIIIDTETTGREANKGHRIIEIGAIVLQDRWISKEQFHTYLNPQRAIDPEALKVHGITETFLQDKPIFTTVIEAFLDFIREAELIIHNAPFDVGFFDQELKLAGAHYGQIKDYCKVTDTLQLARRLHPGQRNSLDALCKRYNIDNTHRALHGALLDANLLARVYLQMTSGQSSLFDEGSLSALKPATIRVNSQNLSLPVIKANHQECAEHEAFLKKLTENTN
jgi:DNA polymerase III subunit epsilon